MNQAEIEDLLQFVAKASRTLNDLDQAAAAAENSQKKHKDRVEKLNQYFEQLGSTILSVDHGTGKYGKSVTDITGAAGGMIQQFGVLGFAIGGVVKLLGGLASASLKQNDALIKTYRTLSEFGNIELNGVDKLQENLADIGTTFENVQYFTQLIGQIAPDLVAFKGSVTDGKNALVEISKGLQAEDVEYKLKNLGFTTEQLTEVSGRYIGQLARVGATQGKSNDQLRKSSFDYMVVLSELSNLTGQSRDTLQKQLEEQNRDVSFRAYLNTLSAEERNQTQLAVTAISAVNKDMGEVAMETLALRGGVRSEKAALMQMQFPGLFKTVRNSIDVGMKGGDTAMAVIKSLQAAEPNIRSQVAQFGETLMAGGPEAAKALNVTSEMYDSLERLKNMGNLEEFSKQIKKIMEDQKGRLALGTVQEQNERKMINAYQSLLKEIGDYAVPMITKLTEGLNLMGYGLAKFTQVTTGGVVDFTHLFRTFDSLSDVTEALSAEDKKQLEYAKKLNANTASNASNEQFIKEQEALKASGKNYNQAGLQKGYQYREDHKTNNAGIQSEISSSRKRQTEARMAGRKFGVGGEDSTNQSRSGEGSPDISKLFNFATGTDISRFNLLQPSLRNKLIAAASDFQKETGGQSLTINSAYRTYLEQQKAYDDYKSGKSKLPAAPPGSSLHEMGLAVDIQDYANQKALDALTKQGLVNKVKNDPVHFEQARNGGLFNGPSSGYPVMLHGKETVLPTKALDNLVSKLPLPGTIFGNNNSNSGNTDELLSVMNNVHNAIDSLSTTFKRSLSVQEDILSHTKMLA